MKLHLEKRSALLVAVTGLWLLSTLGVLIVRHIGNFRIILSDDPLLVTAQLGGFYGAFFGAQLPAIAFVAFVISNSKSRNPVLVAGLVVLLYQMAMFGIRFAQQSGAFAFGEEPGIAALPTHMNLMRSCIWQCPPDDAVMGCFEMLFVFILSCD